jgi:WD40 repeat protein
MIYKSSDMFAKCSYLISTVLISFLWMTACTVATPAPTGTPPIQTMVSVTPLSPILSPTSTSEAPTATEAVAALLSPTAMPSSTPALTETYSTTPSPATRPKQLSHTDPIWGAIIERVSELEGFYALTLSPDGTTLAGVGSENDLDYYVRLWDVATGAVRFELESQEPIGANLLTFSSDGSLLASAASGYVPFVFVWDVSRGVQLHKLPFPDYNSSISFSSDGNLLAVASSFEGATMWSMEDGSSTQLGAGTSVSFASSVPYPLLAVARGWQRTNELSPVQIWNIENNQVEYFFPNSFYSDGISLSSEGHLLAAVIAGEDGIGYLRLWNLHENEEIPVEEGQLGTGQTRQIAFSSKGDLAVLSGELTLWDIEGHFITRFAGEPSQGFMFTPDGNYLLTYNISRGLQVWQLATP